LPPEKILLSIGARPRGGADRTNAQSRGQGGQDWLFHIKYNVQCECKWRRRQSVPNENRTSLSFVTVCIAIMHALQIQIFCLSNYQLTC